MTCHMTLWWRHFNSYPNNDVILSKIGIFAHKNQKTQIKLPKYVVNVIIYHKISQNVENNCKKTLNHVIFNFCCIEKYVFCVNNRATPKNHGVFRKIFLYHLKLHKIWEILAKFHVPTISRFSVLFVGICRGHNVPPWWIGLTH